MKHMLNLDSLDLNPGTFPIPSNEAYVKFGFPGLEPWDIHWNKIESLYYNAPLSKIPFPFFILKENIFKFSLHKLL